MRTFGIDFGREPLKGDSSDDLESNRISFDSIAIMGESLLWFLFKHFLKIFSELTCPLCDRGPPDEQYHQVANWSLRWDHSLWVFRQKAAEILIAFKAGLKDFFISYLFGFGFGFAWFFIFKESKYQKTSISSLIFLCIHEALFAWESLQFHLMCFHKKMANAFTQDIIVNIFTAVTKKTKGFLGFHQAAAQATEKGWRGSNWPYKIHT